MPMPVHSIFPLQFSMSPPPLRHCLQLLNCVPVQLPFIFLQEAINLSEPGL
jgi:hypothetical protein